MAFVARALISVFLVAGLVACTSITTTTSGSRRGADHDVEKLERKVFILDRIEIDHEAVAAGAPVLFSEPAPQRDIGLDRAAAGTFSVSDRGYCSIRTRVSEPAVGLDGQLVGHRYDLLNFDGAINDAGSAATAHRGVGASASSPDEIMIEKEGKDAMWAQAVFNGKKQAYRFHYDRTLLKTIPVAFPWK